ncbi:MAG: AMP-binding protein, partial [Angelakisella sp.]
MQELMSITVGALLEQVADRFPEREAVKYTDRDYRRTWREFDDEVNRVAKGMMAHGIKKGDKVAIWAANTPEWMLTLFAACKI